MGTIIIHELRYIVQHTYIIIYSGWLDSEKIIIQQLVIKYACTHVTAVSIASCMHLDTRHPDGYVISVLHTLVEALRNCLTFEAYTS